MKKKNKPEFENALLPFAPPKSLEEKTEQEYPYVAATVKSGIIGFAYAASSLGVFHYLNDRIITLNLYVSNSSYIAGITLVGVFAGVSSQFFNGENKE